jgi:hypothetical protein
MTVQMEKTRIRRQEALCPGIFDLTLEAPGIAAQARPGQFVNVYLNDASRILPRPISLCRISSSEGTLRLVYRVSGERAGTAELSRCQAGTTLRVLGPLGQGFPCDGAEDVCVVGGGIGVPPLLEVLHALPGRKTAVLGYRNAEQMFLKGEFEAAADEVRIATDDGSFGVRGTAVDGVRALSHRPRMMFGCGPRPMLRALKQYAAEQGIPLWVSMEERMACGIGACLACVVESTETDAHSHVKNKRVCKDGPVFRAEEVVL